MNSHAEPENNPTVAHEHTDADSHAITRFGISLAFIIVVAQLLLWWLFNTFSERETKLSPHVPAIVRAEAPRLPPEPRLQGNAPLDPTPRLDLKMMRENEDAFINHYGWIDPDHGIVHVPIDTALDYVARSGLPNFKAIEPKPPANPRARPTHAAVHTPASPVRPAPVALHHPISPVGATHASPSPQPDSPSPQGVQ